MPRGVVINEHVAMAELQDPSIVNEDNLRNVRRDASRRFRIKYREYLTGIINDIELNSKRPV
jgi:hypothetical protein